MPLGSKRASWGVHFLVHKNSPSLLSYTVNCFLCWYVDQSVVLSCYMRVDFSFSLGSIGMVITSRLTVLPYPTGHKGKPCLDASVPCS